MRSIKQYNKALKDLGIPAELVKCNGYFYYTGNCTTPCGVFVVFESVFGLTSFNKECVEAWQNELNKAKETWQKGLLQDPPDLVYYGGFSSNFGM